jgi:hypothetical protein
MDFRDPEWDHTWVERVHISKNLRGVNGQFRTFCDPYPPRCRQKKVAKIFTRGKCASANLLLWESIFNSLAHVWMGTGLEKFLGRIQKFRIFGALTWR